MIHPSDTLDPALVEAKRYLNHLMVMAPASINRLATRAYYILEELERELTKE